jgi:hypothetical protein
MGHIRALKRTEKYVEDIIKALPRVYALEKSFTEFEEEQEGNEGGEKSPLKGQSWATGLYESVHTWMFISYVLKRPISIKKTVIGRFFMGTRSYVVIMYLKSGLVYTP